MEESIQIKEVGFPELVSTVIENYGNRREDKEDERRTTALGLADRLVEHTKARIIEDAIIVTRPLFEIYNPYTKDTHPEAKLVARLVTKQEDVKLLNSSVMPFWFKESFSYNFPDEFIRSLEKIKNIAFEVSNPDSKYHLQQKIEFFEDEFPLPYTGKEPKKVDFFEAVDLIGKNSKHFFSEREREKVAIHLSEYLIMSTRNISGSNVVEILKPVINIYNDNTFVTAVGITKEDMELLRKNLIDYTKGYSHHGKKEEFVKIAYQLSLPPCERKLEQVLQTIAQ